MALNDCNFHESINMDEFERTKTISFSPPDGESVLMNYRCSGDYPTPFRVFPFIEEVMSSRLDLVLRIRADIPQNLYGSNVVVRIPVPKSTSRSGFPLLTSRSSSPSNFPSFIFFFRSCSADFAGNAAGQSFEFKAADKQAIWRIKRFGGGTEDTIRVKMMVANASSNATKREVGPVSIDFEVSNTTVTGITIKFLRIFERSKDYTPYKWVRCITYSNSYVCRV